MSEWQPIETAPRDGTRIAGRRVTEMAYLGRITWFGKASHVPIYGWCHGTDPEDIDLWQPTHWKHLPPSSRGDEQQQGSDEAG